MRLVFYKVHITESIVGFADNLFSLQKILKRYTVKQSLQTTARGTNPVRKAIFIRLQDILSKMKNSYAYEKLDLAECNASQKQLYYLKGPVL